MSLLSSLASTLRTGGGRRSRRRVIYLALVIFLGYIWSNFDTHSGISLLDNDLGSALTRRQVEFRLPGDDKLCVGWNPENDQDGGKGRKDKWKDCWRSKWYRQISSYDALSPNNGINLQVRLKNHRNLQSILACLPHRRTHKKKVRITIMNEQGEEEEEEVVCRDRMYGVVMLHWWLSMRPFVGLLHSGETIWMRSQIDALESLGYTVISSQGYVNGIDMYNAIPDVVTYIWGEDYSNWSCQLDPYCSSSFIPTHSRYPNLTLTLEDPNSKLSKESKRYRKQGEERRKWIWTEEEVRGIEEGRRGKIPNRKLFSTTYWGWNPGYFGESSMFGNTYDPNNPAPNPLGAEYTLTPIPYPNNHTHLPMSIEKLCHSIPHAPQSAKLNRLFILAKSALYFESTKSKTAPHIEDWAYIKEKLGGIQMVTTAKNGTGEKGNWVPVEVEGMGGMSAEEYVGELGRSKVLVLIGRPPISPSVYDALCQGTPVVLPWSGHEESPDGSKDPWYQYIYSYSKVSYSQHGPALQLGAPYVYGYRFQDTEDLIAKIKMALAHPIESYVPPEMTQQALKDRLDAYMKTDWDAFAEDVVHNGRDKKPVLELIGPCFESGKCFSYVDGSRGDFATCCA